MTNTLQQWEYHRLYLSENGNILDSLQSVGERGWELVSVIREQEYYMSSSPNCWFFFKRPKQQTKEP